MYLQWKGLKMNRNSDFIPFALPSIGEEEKNAVLEVMESLWLTTGKKCIQFEKEFADFTGAKHAITVNSATSGLHLVLESLKLKKGDQILTTPYTFAATSEVIRYVDADPVFADIKSSDYNIDPEKIDRILSKNKNIKAIIPVHIGGLVCDMDRINEIAQQYGVPVIEDSAHAFPVKYKGNYAGNLSHAGVYSFYATKTITTGEGGMVVTNSDSTAQRIKLMRLHGIDRDVWDRYSSNKKKWYYEVVEAGFKYNMTDIAAAMGIEQLKKAERFLEKRKHIAETYNKAFSDYDFIKLPPSPHGENDHAWHLYTIRINEEKLNIKRDEFIDHLFEKGIGVSVHFIPVHIMPYYRERYSLKPDDYPNALNSYSNSISLPVYPDLDNEQVGRIIEAVIETGKNSCR